MKRFLGFLILSTMASASGLRTSQRDLSCVYTFPGETRETVWRYRGHVEFDLSGNDALRLEIRPRFLSDLRLSSEALAPENWRMVGGRLIGTSVKRAEGKVWSISVAISPRAVSFAHHSSEAASYVGRSTRTCTLRESVNPNDLYQTIIRRQRARRATAPGARTRSGVASPTHQELLNESQSRNNQRPGGSAPRRPR